MEKKKPYSSKRWNDSLTPIVVGKVKTTKEQKKEYDKRLERLMRSSGALEANEHIINGKVVRIDENGVIKNENTD